MWKIPTCRCMLFKNVSMASGWMLFQDTSPTVMDVETTVIAVDDKYCGLLPIYVTEVSTK